MNISNRIRTVRRAAGLSQEEVARRAGLSLKGMGDIERGDIDDPHFSSLVKIAHALDVPVESLIKEEEPAAPLAGGLPAWALTSDMETFSQRVSRLSVDDLKRVAENLIGGERTLTLEDLPLPREERDARVINFARVMFVDDEFKQRGVAPPPRFTVAYRRHLDELTPPPDAESLRDADHGSSEAG